MGDRNILGIWKGAGRKLKSTFDFFSAARRGGTRSAPRARKKSQKCALISRVRARVRSIESESLRRAKLTLHVVSPWPENGLTNDSGLSIPGPMSRPYQPPLAGAASRFFSSERSRIGGGGGEKRKRKKGDSPDALTSYLSISRLRHGGRLMMEKQESAAGGGGTGGPINLSFASTIIGRERLSGLNREISRISDIRVGPSGGGRRREWAEEGKSDRDHNYLVASAAARENFVDGPVLRYLLLMRITFRRAATLINAKTRR